MRKIAIVVLLAAISLAVVVALASPEYPIIISAIEIKDLDGYPRTEFHRGEVVVVETVFTANPTYYFVEPVKYLEIVEVFYGPRVMGLLLTRDSISTGEEKRFGGGILIRDTDPTGRYDVEVYAWNGFPSEVGAAWAPLAEPGRASFRVVP